MNKGHEKEREEYGSYLFLVQHNSVIYSVSCVWCGVMEIKGFGDGAFYNGKKVNEKSTVYGGLL